MFSVVEIVCEIRFQLQNLRCGNLVITLLILIYHNFFNASPRVLLYIGLNKNNSRIDWCFHPGTAASIDC